MIRSSHIWWHCLLLLSAARAQWTKPNAHLPSFADTYTVGERIILSWQTLNDSSNDLWLTRYDATTDDFALRLATSYDVSKANSFDWTIAIDSATVIADTRFLLQFLPVGVAYDTSATPSLPSPAFNLILVNQASPPNGTAGTSTSSSTLSSTTTTTPSAAPTLNNTTSSNEAGSAQNPILSNAAKIGIGIGALGLTVVVALVTVAWVGKRRRAREVTGQEQIIGPYEVLGDKRLASEISSKEISVYELNGGRENSVSEAASSPIHEMATIVKKPGLHELPG